MYSPRLVTTKYSKPTQHKHLIPPVKHSGGEVMIWASFTVTDPGHLAITVELTVNSSVSRLSMHSKTCDGCKRCPVGWILMNSVCYYFSLKSNEMKTWKESRDFCQLQGGDLIIIDSQDKEVYFWIGLSDSKEEGTWKWLDGTFLVQGYWNDGEPNNLNDEDCAAVYPRVNFFKAWNDVRCGVRRKWICEKAPESMS
uniref:CD209 antigen-like protein E n=1 Tax=Pundamilia nyererei TaxID=303518 RepID=A0A3B4H1M8_9CICH